MQIIRTSTDLMIPCMIKTTFKLVRGNIQELYKGAIRHSELISQLWPVAEKGEDRFVALRSPNVAGGTSLFAESRAR